MPAAALKLAGPEPAADRNLDHLHPVMRVRVDALIAWLKSRGWNVIVTEVRRTSERQTWLWNLGRTTYHKDGRGKGGRIVTKARTAATTWHGYGFAVDVVDKDVLWNERHPQYAAWCGDLAVGAAKFGLRWGGDWDGNPRTKESFPDVPHLQLLELPRSPSKDDIADFNLGTQFKVATRYKLLPPAVPVAA